MNHSGSFPGFCIFMQEKSADNLSIRFQPVLSHSGLSCILFASGATIRITMEYRWEQLTINLIPAHLYRNTRVFMHEYLHHIMQSVLCFIAVSITNTVRIPEKIYFFTARQIYNRVTFEFRLFEFTLLFLTFTRQTQNVKHIWIIN